MIKRISAALTSFVLILSMLSCGKGTDFSHAEFEIPLSDDYYEIENENFDATFTNGRNLVAVLRISFVAGLKEGIAETMTPYEFAEFWLERCEREANVVDDGIIYCQYYDASGGKEQLYIEAFYRSEYAYFVLLLATGAEYEAEEFDTLLDYAKGVHIGD